MEYVNTAPAFKIRTIQVFFDTDITDDDYVKILSLRDNILQVETSLNWEQFSKLDRICQKKTFIKKLHKVAMEVAKKYKLDYAEINTAFKKLFEEIILRK